jgi:NADP-dependent aldehyde dehydrogenase
MTDTLLTGTNFIEGQPSNLGPDRVPPHRGNGPATATATPEEIAKAAQAAAFAFETYGSESPERRAQFLEAIADEIEKLGDELLQTASHESALPLPRLTGERARTTGQLRMFAKLLRDGLWTDVRIEEADPSRSPIPKPDLRRTKVPLGPVAVFGASNFPLAFSVAGGDTASALAAGCPVIVKAHPSHPATSELVGRAIMRAAEASGMPAGVFGLLHGGPEVGKGLVLRPEIYAVGFTGSQKAGRALFDLGASRPRPIPVYSEMGSVNPLFVFPGALAARSEKIAEGYAGSLTLGVGQFCTNPGVVIGLAGDAFDGFLASVSERLRGVSEGTMLDEGIRRRYLEGVAELSAHVAVESACMEEGVRPALFITSGAEFLQRPELREELFGPAAVAVRCTDEAEMEAVARILEGQLTATVHFEPSDTEAVRQLLPLLVRMAGRVLANGFPTGVEVNSAMQHGGPYPATTDSRSTSVGTAAIERFLRPVAFQDFPPELLPPELRG